MLTKALALALLAPLAAVLSGCDEDAANEHFDLGPIYLDASTMETGAFDRAPAADARNDASTALDGSSDGAPPVELSATACAPFAMPGLENPLDTLIAVALTKTRVYAASRSEIRAFERLDACAGPLVAGFGNGGVLRTEAVALAAGPGDTVLVSGAQGTALLDATGASVATCSSSRARTLAVLPELGSGYAILAGPALMRVSVRSDGCGLSGPLGLPDPSFALHAAAPVRADPFRALLAIQPRATETPRVVDLETTSSRSVTPPAEAPRPCSVRSVVDTDLGVATLDPSCGKVAWLDVSSGARRFVYSIADGEFGRALVSVPDGTKALLSLATVSEPGRAPKLYSIALVPP